MAVFSLKCAFDIYSEVYPQKCKNCMLKVMCIDLGKKRYIINVELLLSKRQILPTF